MNTNRKGSALLIVLAVIAVLAIATGCVNQLWPAERPSAAVTSYVGEPTGGFPITTLGNAKATKQKVQVKHVTTMIDLKAALDKDDAIYNIAMDELNLRIQASQAMYDKYVGTPEAPGLLGSVLFAALAGLGVHTYNKNTMYSEAEVKALAGTKPENKHTA
jgi:hypothetical protein